MNKDTKLIKIVELVEKKYSKKKMIHATKVATYAMANAIYDSRIDPVDAYIVGIAHDLLEDTDCTYTDLKELLGEKLADAVLLLTKGEDESYENYMELLFTKGDKLSILVKRADMKDHFSRVETLTEKLKNKYTPYMKDLL